MNMSEKRFIPVKMCDLSKCSAELERLRNENEQLRRDEQLYAKEILRLKEELKQREIVKLGGDY